MVYLQSCTQYLWLESEQWMHNYIVKWFVLNQQKCRMELTRDRWAWPAYHHTLLSNILRFFLIHFTDIWHIVWLMKLGHNHIMNNQSSESLFGSMRLGEEKWKKKKKALLMNSSEHNQIHIWLNRPTKHELVFYFLFCTFFQAFDLKYNEVWVVVALV